MGTRADPGQDSCIGLLEGAALFTSRMLCVWLGKPHVLSAAPITGFASSI